MSLVLELYLTKGLPVPIGSSGSFEQQERINLLDPKSFSVEENGWIPKLGQVRNGGVYTDTAATETPDVFLAANIGRVIETMNLVAHGADPKARYFLEQKLLRFADLAREFHISNSQTEPVYLHWRGVGAAGPQFALVYDIAIAQNNDPTVQANSDRLTITITREPDWMWEVPPGASPRIWTFYKRAIPPTSVLDYALNDLPVYFGAAAGGVAAANILLLDALVESKGHQSYVEIPAADIPGDRPAAISFRTSAAFARDFSEDQNVFVSAMWVARSTRKTYNYIPNNRLPAKCAGTIAGGAQIETALGTPDMSYEADYGAIDHHAPNLASYYVATTYHNRARCTFATTGTVFRKCVTWTFRMPPSAGRYAVFMRGHQSAGALGDIEIYLQYGYYEGAELTTGIVNPLVQTVAANTNFWPVNFLGTITLHPMRPAYPLATLDWVSMLIPMP